MYITITGNLGSGKSEVCKILNEQLGFTIFSTGTIHRDFAILKGMTTLQLNTELTKLGKEFDEYIDNRVKAHSKENIGKKVAYDSRMAWHFVNESLKVFLQVDPIVAGQRCYLARQGADESFNSPEEATQMLIERKRKEDERFKLFYKVDCSDLTNFDIAIDTTYITPQEVAEKIMEAYDKRYSV